MCPFCQEANKEHKLNETHVLFFCKDLETLQGRLGFRGYLSSTNNIKNDVLWQFLGGDKCESKELLRRGKQLLTFMDEYLDRVYKTPPVLQLLS